MTTQELKRAEKKFERIYNGIEKGYVEYKEEKITFLQYAEGDWLWEWANKAVPMTGNNWSIFIEEDENNHEWGYKAIFNYRGKDYDFVPMF